MHGKLENITNEIKNKINIKIYKKYFSLFIL